MEVLGGRGRHFALLAGSVAALCVAAVAVFGIATTSAASFSFLGQWGGVGSGPGQFDSSDGPDDIALDSVGNAYVSDKDGSNSRIEKFTATGAFLTQWGSSGTGAGQFNDEQGIATDQADNVYVADAGNQRIQVFDSSGNFKFTFGWGVSNGASAPQVCTSSCQAGVPGAGAGQFSTPAGLAVDPAGNIWVADDADNRISKFDANGAFQFTAGFGVATGAATFEICTSACLAGISGAGDGQFNGVDRIAADSAGNVYATDGNNRVQKFNSSGAFLTKWGSTGTAEGQFGEVDDIAVDPNGNLWVSDPGHNRIEQFTSSGAFLSMAGFGVADGVSNSFQTCTSGCFAGIPGAGDGQLSSPQGLGIDCRGTVYVVDADNFRIERFGDPGAAPPPCPTANPKPSNAFSFGKLTRNRKRGTAKQTVIVPGAGKMTASGKGLVTQRPGATASKTVSAAGPVKLLIKAKGKAKRKLNRTGKVKLKAVFTFTPTGGDQNTHSKKIKLLKRLP